MSDQEHNPPFVFLSKSSPHHPNQIAQRPPKFQLAVLSSMSVAGTSQPSRNILKPHKSDPRLRTRTQLRASHCHIQNGHLPYSSETTPAPFAFHVDFMSKVVILGTLLKTRRPRNYSQSVHWTPKYRQILYLLAGGHIGRSWS